MDKITFLGQLEKALSCLPKQDVKERLTFYSEMVDDRMEEGLTEEEAVAQIGEVQTLAAQIIDEAPAKTKPKKKRRGVGNILLLCLGAPLWIPLLIAFCAVVFSLLLVMWVVVGCLWVVDGVFMLCGPIFSVCGIVLICTGNAVPGIALIACGMFLTGVGLLWFYPCKYASKGALWLTKWLFTRRRKKAKDNGED